MSETPPFLKSLLRSVARYPAQPALTFWSEGDEPTTSITYAELYSQANALAEQFRAAGLQRRAVLLALPAGLEFPVAFAACVLAGVVAVPVPVPRQRAKEQWRLSAISQDCQAALVLMATHAPAEFLVSAQANQAQHVPVQRFNALDLAAVGGVPTHAGRHREETLFLQYTSGSTGSPKGCVVTHANVLHNAEQTRILMQHDDGAVLATWLPHTHDLGLVGNFLQAWHVAGHLHFMPPAAFVRRPLRWLHMISRARACTAMSPNFGYDLCVDRATAPDVKALDLTCWRTALNGAEPVRNRTIQRFVRTFAPAGFDAATFLPAYGMAEATLIVTAARGAQTRMQRPRTTDTSESAKTTDQPAVVSCGNPFPGMRVDIVDEQGRPRAEGEVGEIVVSGPSVCQGYWDAARSDLVEPVPPFLAGSALATGDLGFVSEGALYVTGRKKDVLVLRGRKLLAVDLEHVAQDCHPAIVPAGVCALAVPGQEEGLDERLVLLVEMRPTATSQADVAPSVRQALTEALVDAFECTPSEVCFVPQNSLPKTTSGKLQRSVAFQRYAQGELTDAFAKPQGERTDNTAAKPQGERTDNTAAKPQGERTDNIVAKPQGERTHDTIAGKPAQCAEAPTADPRGRWLQDVERAVTRSSAWLADERRSLSPQLVLDLGNLGALGARAPSVHGGLQLSSKEYADLLTLLGRHDQCVALLLLLNNSLVVRPLTRFGTQTQQARHLPALARGRILGAFALTEPGAGSDPRALQSYAGPNGHGGWRLFGRKVWIGNAGWASVMIVFAKRLDDQGQPVGITAFLVPTDRAGVHIGDEAMTMGMKGMVQNEVVLDGVEVGPEDVLGRLDRGMDVATDAMTEGRLALAAASLGAMHTALGLALAYARERQVVGGVLADNAVLRSRLAPSSFQLRALTQWTRSLAEALDGGHTPPNEVMAAIKIFASEALWNTIDRCAQAMGGRSYVEPSGLPKLIRDARVVRIFEGPSETLLAHVGSQALTAPDALMGYLTGEADGASPAHTLAHHLAELRGAPRPPTVPPSDHEALQRYFAGRLVLAALCRHALRHADPSSITWARMEYDTEVRSAQEALQQVVPGAAEMARDLLPLPRPAHQPVEDWRGDVYVAGTQRARAPRPPAPQTKAKPLFPAVPQHDSAERTALRQWMRAWVTRRFPAAPFDESASFNALGFDSVTAMEFTADLEDMLGRAVESTVLWDHPTPARLLEVLLPAKSADLAATQVRAEPDSIDDLLSRAQDLLSK